MANNKDSNYLRSGSKTSLRLRDLDKEKLFKKIKEIEEYDKVKYRKTCGRYQQIPRRNTTKCSDGRFGGLWGSSSSEEAENSEEYENLDPYVPGSLGLIRCREKKRVVRPVSSKKLVPKETSFDWLSSIIVSELGILSKFQKKKKNEYVKSASTIREKRRHYVS